VPAKKGQTIIVKKVKGGGHGHHGGAWKVAYADFVTAMMAFFLLLWLLNAVPKEQLQGIADYFAPVSIPTPKSSGGRGMLAGETVAKQGVFQIDAPYPPLPGDRAPTGPADAFLEAAGDREPSPEDLSEDQLREAMAKQEEKQFKEAEKQLRDAIGDSPDLKGLAKSLIIDDTPEGLRIGIIDQEGLPMFPRGESEMYPYTRRVLELVAKVVQRMPQNIDITGHTDAVRYQGGGAYTNWELSADRANAARRELLQLGVAEGRITRVVGKAATEPLFPNDPEAPGNRRLSVVLLRGTGTEK
jgi:chemotaxis protein MotB